MEDDFVLTKRFQIERLKFRKLIQYCGFENFNMNKNVGL